jgi:hypothetical protein
MFEKSVCAEGGEAKDGRTDYQQVEDVENLVDDFREMVEIRHVAPFSVIRNQSQHQHRQFEL